MNKSFLINLVTVMVLVVFAVGGCGATEQKEPVKPKTWEEVMKLKTLPEISKIIKSSGVGDIKGWPAIASLNAIDEIAKEENQEQVAALANAMSLFEKIREYESANTGFEPTAAQEVVSTYANLSKALRRSGGYTNLVLADTVNRLAVRRIGAYLKTTEDKKVPPYEQASQMLATLELPGLSMSEFARVMVDEKYKVKEGTDFDTIAGAKTLLEVLTALGTNYSEMYGQFNGRIAQKGSTVLLLHERDLPSLLWRMGETDMIATAFLPGFLEFIAKGGRYSDLKLPDSPPLPGEKKSQSIESDTPETPEATELTEEEQKKFQELASKRAAEWGKMLNDTLERFMDKEARSRFKHEFMGVYGINGTTVKVVYDNLVSPENEPFFYAMALV